MCFYFDIFFILVYNQLANITYNLLLLIYNSFKLYIKKKIPKIMENTTHKQNQLLID